MTPEEPPSPQRGCFLDLGFLSQMFSLYSGLEKPNGINIPLRVEGGLFNSFSAWAIWSAVLRAWHHIINIHKLFYGGDDKCDWFWWGQCGSGDDNEWQLGINGFIHYKEALLIVHHTFYYNIRLNRTALLHRRPRFYYSASANQFVYTV